MGTVNDSGLLDEGIREEELCCVVRTPADR